MYCYLKRKTSGKSKNCRNVDLLTYLLNKEGYLMYRKFRIILKSTNHGSDYAPIEK
jgi:hypothetical protein